MCATQLLIDTYNRILGDLCFILGPNKEKIEFREDYDFPEKAFSAADFSLICASCSKVRFFSSFSFRHFVITKRNSPFPFFWVITNRQFRI